MTTSNNLTPSELHTVRAMVREQEHAAVSNGREFAGPWLIIKRLLAERDASRETMREILDCVDCSHCMNKVNEVLK